MTHYTNECKKYNTDGTIKEGFGRGGKGSPKDAKTAKKEKARYAQLYREIKAMKHSYKELQKANRKLAKKVKSGYQSDSSDSD